jgi:hypothetical protein
VPATIAWQGVEVRCGDSIGQVRALVTEMVGIGM